MRASWGLSGVFIFLACLGLAAGHAPAPGDSRDVFSTWPMPSADAAAVSSSVEGLLTVVAAGMNREDSVRPNANAGGEALQPDGELTFRAAAIEIMMGGPESRCHVAPATAAGHANVVTPLSLESCQVPAPEVATVEIAAAPRRSAPTASLVSWPDGLRVGSQGALSSVFGFAPDAAREILFPVTKQRELPLTYRPTDLTTVAGQRSGVLVRAVLLADVEALLLAAQRSGLTLAAVSGYRSSGTQAALFDQRARDRLAQSGGAMTLEEARQRANQGTALPGYSQHQLGTAVDFSTGAVGYQVTPAFAGTPAAAWLREHAWEFGFVLPYTELGRERTGYIPEPWHLRWVGRPLAALLMADGYLDATDIVADDYLEALETLLDNPSLLEPAART